jgi:SAM-dependent methyltransferase
MDESGRNEAIKSLRPYVERARQFSGWDFSEVSVRRLGSAPPWSYPSLVREAARFASSALDMGTGGGEFLAEVSTSLPDRVVATEEWKVNVPVAKERLTRFGIDVTECRSVQLPFKDASFDLVLNRHEELEPSEVARVLSPGGRVITQQIGRDNWKELRKHLPRTTDQGDHREQYAKGFQAAGLKIAANLKHDCKVPYATLGDFVFMLAVTPWTIPAFSLEGDIDSLLSLEKECGTQNGLELTESRFLLIAGKPKQSSI